MSGFSCLTLVNPVSDNFFFFLPRSTFNLFTFAISMNRFSELFKQKPRNVLSVYFPAGYPHLNSTAELLKDLQASGADMVEIGIPFSDPLADGEVIQQAGKVALENGINLDIIFQQLQDARKTIHIPLVLMGYYNSVLQYGIDKFCGKCSKVGIDGVILPDLPYDEFEKECAKHFKEHSLQFISLITPQTSDEKIRMIDKRSEAFIYAVSSSSTTGAKDKFSPSHEEYFKRIQAMKLKNPVLVGFGVSNHDTFTTVCKYLNGVVIGSAFIKVLNGKDTLQNDIQKFVTTVSFSK